jgi:hypothetical protein
LWRHLSKKKKKEIEALWRPVVDCKFGSSWGGWCSGEVNELHGVGLWKFIRKGWGDFSRYTRLVVRDDSKVRFWHDVWCGEQFLKVVLLEIFCLAPSKDATAAKHL